MTIEETLYNFWYYVKQVKSAAGLPKKAILQPRVLDPGLKRSDWVFMILTGILVTVTAVSVTSCCLKPHGQPKTYEDCRSTYE